MDDLTNIHLIAREVASFDRIFNCILPKKWPIKSKQAFVKCILERTLTQLETNIFLLQSAFS